MLGAIIGDIVGSVYEWNNIKTKSFVLFDEKSCFTDDTVMTIAVADALLNGGAKNDFIDSMKKFGRLYPSAGYGGHFSRWVFSGDREPYNSWGNGAAMRVSPCAWYAQSLDEAENLAEMSAVVTHNHPEGIKGARATAAAIYLARNLPGVSGAKSVFKRNRGKPQGIDPDRIKAEIKGYIESKYGYDLSRTLDEIRPVYQFNESCQKTVPEAIIAFLESQSFVDAIRNAISLGGDSDTLAAITGSIAEAAYKVPSVVTKYAFIKLDDTLSAVINAWLDRDKPIGAVIKKSNWKTNDFSKPHSIKANFCFTETQFARIRHGLLPEAMEDKWFAYFENGRICFHQSWIGAKIYEAKIQKSNSNYIISDVIVERDAKIYANTDDAYDIHSFEFLVSRGLLGLQVALPFKKGLEDNDLFWFVFFGNMIYS
jgi:ADP-ribosylglycohydrolase